MEMLIWITVATQKLTQSHSVYLSDLLYSYDSHYEVAGDFTFTILCLYALTTKSGNQLALRFHFHGFTVHFA